MFIVLCFGPLIEFELKHLANAFFANRGQALTVVILYKFHLTVMVMAVYKKSPTAYYDAVKRGSKLYFYDPNLFLSEDDYRAVWMAYRVVADQSNKEAYEHTIEGGELQDEEPLWERPAYTRDAVMFKSD